MRQPAPAEAKEMLTYISPRPDYETWIKIISAIGNTFELNIALDILLSRFKDEKPNEHAIKLKNCLKNVTFATMVYYAKQNGYKSTFNITQAKNIYDSYINHSKIIANSYLNHSKIIANSYLNYSKIIANSYLNQSKTISFADANTSFYYRFDDDIEERLAVLQYEGNISRADAEKITLTETPEMPRERAYRIAVNNKVINKSNDYKKLNENFENFILSSNEIAHQIGQGFSIICGMLKTDGTGKVKRNNESWLCSELITLDIDTGLTIDEAFNIPQTKHALIIYTSPSHTPEQHHFRIIFDLPYVEYNKQRYREILSNFIDIYNADKQCKDSARIYFGNSNTTIYILRTGKTHHYKNGVLVND
jgi:hypothetical protein